MTPSLSIQPHIQAEESSLIEELQRVMEDEKRKFKAWKVRPFAV